MTFESPHDLYILARRCGGHIGKRKTRESDAISCIIHIELEAFINDRSVAIRIMTYCFPID